MADAPLWVRPPATAMPLPPVRGGVSYRFLRVATEPAGGTYPNSEPWSALRVVQSPQSVAWGEILRAAVAETTGLLTVAGQLNLHESAAAQHGPSREVPHTTTQYGRQGELAACRDHSLEVALRHASRCGAWSCPG
jgi:hypothetical protein